MTPSERTKYEPVPLPDQPPVSAGESLEGARPAVAIALRITASLTSMLA